jgi:hypothetical protein
VRPCVSLVCIQDVIDQNWDFFKNVFKSEIDPTSPYETQIKDSVAYVKSHFAVSMCVQRPLPPSQTHTHARARAY